jgi:hypothetical protein
MAQATPAAFPWPPAQDASPLDAGVATWKESMLAPAHFFARMPAHAPLLPAYLYVAALSVLGVALGLFWQELLAGVRISDVDADGDGRAPALGLAALILTPVLLFPALLLSAAILHLLLRVLGAAHRPIGTTLRVLCYAWGSPQLMMIVPVLGGPMSAIWALVLAVIGLREAHGTTTGRAVVAVLIPAVLLALLTALIAGLLWMMDVELG